MAQIFSPYSVETPKAYKFNIYKFKVGKFRKGEFPFGKPLRGHRNIFIVLWSWDDISSNTRGGAKPNLYTLSQNQIETRRSFIAGINQSGSIIVG